MAFRVTATGHFHCSVKGVGRAKGRSIVAAATYRAGERLTDEKTGIVQDYHLRRGVVDAFIIAPGDAPAWASNRQRLWNEAESIEARVNGRLATELELALPCELPAEERRELLTGFVRDLVDRHHVAADVAIHEPGEGSDHRNHHAHVLLTHREIGPEGFGEIANTRTATRKRRGEIVQEKVFGIAATPGDIRAIRRKWEQVVNRTYERAGLDIRVDHRSHQDRGIEEVPGVHLGPAATGMERRGEASDRGDINREVERQNAGQQQQTVLEAEAAAIKGELKEALDHWDRDAANRDWEERIAAAAIAHDAAGVVPPSPPVVSQHERQADEAARRVPGHGDTVPVFTALQRGQGAREDSARAAESADSFAILFPEAAQLETLEAAPAELAPGMAARIEREQLWDSMHAPAENPGKESAGFGRGLLVAADTIDGAVQTASDFAEGLLGFLTGSEKPRPISPAEWLFDPEAQREVQRREAARRVEAAALDRINDDIKHANLIDPQAMRSLTPETLIGIRDQGDAYLRALLEAREQQQREAAQERERER